MRYYQFVLGCQMNTSDSERLACLLESLGFEKTDQESEADLIAVQACSVRQSAIDRIHGRIKRWQAWQKDRKLVTLLSGCVLEKDKQNLGQQFDLLIDTHQLAKKLPLELAKRLPLLKPKPKIEEFFSLAPKHRSNFQAFVPIQTGCNNFCTFCAVPYTKGREKYRPHQDILREIKDLIAKGYKEITLLGQNVNTYFDPTLKDAVTKSEPKQWNTLTDFPRLLHLVNDIPGDFWVRFVSSNPWDMSDATIRAVAECEKLCECIHFALQSGSNKILKRMNRQHTRQHYLDLVKKIRKLIPGVAITTDIIVGFPGETRLDFEDTAKVMAEVKYDMAYIARYSARPGTTATKLYRDNVSVAEKLKREAKLEKILSNTSLANNQRYLGKRVGVLVEGVKSGTAFGRTRTYKLVRFPGSKNLIGRFVEVQVKEARNFGLSGDLV